MPHKWNRVKAILAEQEGIDFESNEQAVEQVFDMLIDRYGEQVRVVNKEQ